MDNHPEPNNSQEPERSAMDSGSGRDYTGAPWEDYTDAAYIPHDQAPRTPRTYSYAESELRESRQRREEQERRRDRHGMTAGAVIALCLVCLLLGMAAGVLTTGRAWLQQVKDSFSGVTAGESVEETGGGESSESTAAPETATPDPHAVKDGTASENAAGESLPLLASAAEVSEQLAATEIYDRACRQVVGISTEVTYASQFGTQTGQVTGSGFIVDESGYILTNYHVVEYAAQGGYPVTVMLYNGDSYPATLVGFENDDSDLAVLKIEAEGLDAADLGDSNSILVGETVYAVGNPLGELDYTMTKGMISAMDREITTTNDAGVSTTVNMFQIDAAVNSGNSGGPVYNNEGEVIGIVTAKYSDSYAEMGIEGLGFAIPIDDAVSVANDLIQNGYVRGKAYMGISTKSVSSAAAQYYNMVEGAYVYGMVEGSCADQAGLRMGDIITAVDNTPITSVSDLQTALKNYSAGESAQIALYRSGETLTVTIVFDEKQPNSETIQTQSTAPNSYTDSGGSFNYGGFNW